MATASSNSHLSFPLATEALEAATTRLQGAETELATALDELRPSERQDKQMVSTRMRRALDEIKAAKVALRALQPGLAPELEVSSDELDSSSDS